MSLAPPFNVDLLPYAANREFTHRLREIVASRVPMRGPECHVEEFGDLRWTHQRGRHVESVSRPRIRVMPLIMLT